MMRLRPTIKLSSVSFPCFVIIIMSFLVWFCPLPLEATYPLPDPLPQQLDDALDMVRGGRVYQLNFPESRTRKRMREIYLGVDSDGNNDPLEEAKFDILEEGLNLAVDFRTKEETVLIASTEELTAAQIIAWEALESILQGQLLVGNGNFLKALRVAFPGAGGGEKPGGDDTIPVGCPGPESGGEYLGSNTIDLFYAKLHFFQGIAASINYMNRDKDLNLLDNQGVLRATDLFYTQSFPQYTIFLDPAFATDTNTSGMIDIQTAGYLLGNTIDRYGKSVVSIGDRLWRAAYFDKNRAPGGSREAERPEMLEAAMAEMQRGIHSQYMAVLPLAATLNDGSQGGYNEYQLCRLDQVRISAATSASFIDRIRRGEIPKLNTLDFDASENNINNKIGYVKQKYDIAKNFYDQAEEAIWKVKESEAAAIDDAQNLKFQFTDEITAATGLSPGTENQDPYYGLTTEAGRKAYREDLNTRIATALDSSTPFDDTVFTHSGELGRVILQMRRAFADIESARNRIDTIPQQIRIEELRVDAINGVILGTEDKVAACRLAQGIAESVSVTAYAETSCSWSSCPEVKAGVAVTVNPGAVASAMFQNEAGRAEAISKVEINNIESEATIRNLLLQQNQYIIDMKSAALQGQLAIADLNSTLSSIDRLIENHIYYRESNESKWYYDPALIFEQEEEELKYENALRELVRELYKLSQLLAARWSEPFENPYLTATGQSVSLGAGSFDDFTQAESVFNVYDVDQARLYYAALEAWHYELQNERKGGEKERSEIISLRQDIFGLTDVKWDTDTSSFVEDPSLKEDNVRRFRSLLLSHAREAPSDFQLRIEFPLTYNQISKRAVGTTQWPVINASRQDWNIRMTMMSAEILGENVAPGAATNKFGIDLYQYGKIEIPTYHPRQTSVYPNFLTYNLPLYYPDPEIMSISPFQYSLDAGVNNQSGSEIDITNRLPSPFCSKYVLLIFRSAGELNIQNIEDIMLNITWVGGKLPDFEWKIL